VSVPRHANRLWRSPAIPRDRRHRTKTRQVRLMCLMQCLSSACSTASARHAYAARRITCWHLHRNVAGQTSHGQLGLRRCFLRKAELPPRRLVHSGHGKSEVAAPRRPRSPTLLSGEVGGRPLFTSVASTRLPMERLWRRGFAAGGNRTQIAEAGAVSKSQQTVASELPTVAAESASVIGGRA
jgi:hypothetical protein